MKAKPCGLALTLLLGVVGGGCTSSPTVDASARHPGGISQSLVMMPGAGWSGTAEGQAWRGAGGGWEYGRNDTRLNVGGAVAPRRLEWAEIRSRDRTRTVNGRPREFSTTFVRTYSLRQVQ